MATNLEAYTRLLNLKNKLINEKGSPAFINNQRLLEIIQAIEYSVFNATGEEGIVITNVTYYSDLPDPVVYYGKYYRVLKGSGGVVVPILNYRIGGHDPGIYYSDGITWKIQRDIDETDVYLDNTGRTEITASVLDNALDQIDTQLSNKSNIGHTHAKTDITDFNEGDYATATQGALADTALQAGDNVSVLNNDAGYLTSVTGGDVDGPASSVDNRIATFDGTTGKLIQDSGSVVGDFATSAQGTLADTAIQLIDLVTYIEDQFETVSKNLRSYNYEIFYTGGGNIDYIEYNTGAGTITKTFNYSGDLITSIVLSGTIAGIDLTKSFMYDINDNIELVSYS